jgi:pimeloyl-ACP methyl ester carboxylesterase
MLKFAFLSLIAILSLALPLPASLAKAQTIPAAIDAQSAFPWLMTYKQRHLNHLYAFESEPLGEQIPLIIIPGRAQEGQSNPWWQKLKEYIAAYPDVAKRYKFYIYLYDSKQDVYFTAREFKQEFSYFLKYLPETAKPVVIISYSMGGQVVQSAFLSQPDLMNRVSTIFGMSVPYHGSPLFDPEWLAGQFTHYSPVRRGWDKLIYGLYMRGKPHLIRDMSFVNFDTSKPVSVTPRKVLNVVNRKPIMLRLNEPKLIDSRDESLRAFKKRLIVYASYLKSPQSEGPQALSALDQISRVNNLVLGAVYPTYVPSVHRSLEFMGREMAQLPVANVNLPYGKSQGHPYRFNDGVIPASSLFYLPVRDRPYTEYISDYPSVWNICNGRFFENLDHVDLGHYRYPERLLVARDVFHPEQTARMPLDWLFTDLRNLDNPNGFTCQ